MASMRPIQNTILTFLFLAMASTTGCAVDGSGSCAAAADQMQRCFGASAAGAFAPQSCKPEMADPIGELSCDQLASLMLDGKADSGVQAQIRDSIKKAIKDALIKGLQEAARQVAKVLGGALEQRDFYVILYTTADETAAQSKAAELGKVFGPSATPKVIAADDTLYVVHDICPADVLDDLPRYLASLLLDHAKGLEAIGGRIERKSKYLGLSQTIDIYVPISFLPVTPAYAAQVGCAR